MALRISRSRLSSTKDYLDGLKGVGGPPVKIAAAIVLGLATVLVVYTAASTGVDQLLSGFVGSVNID